MECLRSDKKLEISDIYLPQLPLHPVPYSISINKSFYYLTPELHSPIKSWRIAPKEREPVCEIEIEA